MFGKGKSHGSGLSVTWVPDVPGTPSPMEYTPWVGTPETTAEEYLCVEGPNPMRVLMVGAEEADREDSAFWDAVEAWPAMAPEATLRDLLPTYDRISVGMSQEDKGDLVHRLLTAYDGRGIPTLEEIEVRVKRDGLNTDLSLWREPDGA